MSAVMCHPNYERVLGNRPGPRKPSRSFLALLAVLRTATPGVGIPVGEAGRAAGVEQSIASRVLARMGRMGIAADLLDDETPDNRPRHLWWLTRTGQQVAAELLDDPAPGSDK